MRIKKAISSLVIMSVSSVIVFSLVFVGLAHAAFNEGNLIDDPIFNDATSMTALQINNFLNTFPSSCISPNNGFSAPDPTGYTPSNGFTYGGNVSAGQVIDDAALAYGLNPQVLLTTIQKEQSLVSGGSGCSTLAYSGATGYGCPDGGSQYSYSGINLYTLNGNTVTSVNNTCVNSSTKVGFSRQVIHTAWLLEYGMQRSQGNINFDEQWTNYPQSGDVWNNSDDPQSCYSGPMTQGTFQICPGGSSTYYDGYYTIDGSSIYLDNGATASLYWYTPHFSGNQNFDTIFTNWFGSTQANGEILTNSLGTNQLSPGTTMHAGDYIVSPNGKFVTTMQYNGNFVTYAGNTMVWSSGTPGNYGGNYAVFQNDGNLVVYNPENQALWWSGTYGMSATSMTLGNDGNIDIYANSTQLYSTAVKVNSYAVTNVGSQITSQATMTAGDYLQSPDGRYSLVMQSDGNLVLYDAANQALWWSGTYGWPGAYAVMQSDGNLVVYSAKNQALWWTGTYGNGASTLTMQNDGNLVVYRNSNNSFDWATWTQFNNYQVNTYLGTQIASGTTLYAGDYLRSPDWRYTLVMQEDGNLVVYYAGGYTAIWSSRTWNNPGAYAVMQNDGNLVVYSANSVPLWNTYTYSDGASVLKMQSDGNLVIYRNSDSQYTWDSYGY